MPSNRTFAFLAMSVAAMAMPCVASATAQSPTCHVDHAHYRYSGGDGDGEADLSVLPGLKGFMSKVLLHVRVAGSNDFWFLFDQGSGRYVRLVSITNPHAPGWTPPDPDGGARPLPDQTFFAWNEALKVGETMPQQGDTAPGYFLMPDLPETLWYRMRNGQRIGLAAGIFRLDRCD